MNGSPWVIIDTETDGLYEPIHVVELSAQRMEGWNPVGEPFRMLLNHDVPIPPEAVAIHGYTQEFLRKNGADPVEVYEAFRGYAADLPLIAHNLSYDWNRCLEPEWARLRLPQIGQRGFCCMMLARRLVPETTSYRLEVLKQRFQITPSRSHRALNDVLTVVELFQKVYKPRLESAGLDTFNDVAAFARRTPVAKCLDIIRTGSAPRPKCTQPTNRWYYLDSEKNDHGPLTASEINSIVGREAFYVWREGLSEWVVNLQCPEFLALCQTTIATREAQPNPATAKTMTELIGLCRGIIADGKVTNAEVMLLNDWLQDVGFINEWPASEIAQTLERILEDGKITKDEKTELQRLLEKVTGNPAKQPDTTVAITIKETSTESSPFTCLSIKLDQGTPEWLEWRHQGIGASDAPVVMNENPWKASAELLREKRGRPRPSIQNAAMARGTMLEPEARDRYISRISDVVRPACFQSIQYPWQRASVDGITSDGSRIVEIKCGDSVYRKTALTGCVPDYYYGQLQHIMAVTGISAVDFFCYLPGRPEVLVQVPRDDDYIARLIRAEIAFWAKVIGR